MDPAQMNPLPSGLTVEEQINRLSVARLIEYGSHMVGAGFDIKLAEDPNDGVYCWHYKDRVFKGTNSANIPGKEAVVYALKNEMLGP